MTFNKGVILLAFELNVTIDNLSCSFKFSIINSKVSFIKSNYSSPYILPLTSITAIKSVGDLYSLLVLGLVKVIIDGIKLEFNCHHC